MSASQKAVLSEEQLSYLMELDQLVNESGVYTRTRDLVSMFNTKYPGMNLTYKVLNRRIENRKAELEAQVSIKANGWYFF